MTLGAWRPSSRRGGLGFCGELAGAMVGAGGVVPSVVGPHGRFAGGRGLHPLRAPSRLVRVRARRRHAVPGRGRGLLRPGLTVSPGSCYADPMAHVTFEDLASLDVLALLLLAVLAGVCVVGGLFVWTKSANDKAVVVASERAATALESLARTAERAATRIPR